MMRLIILDPGLLELSGHHFNYNNSIFKECSSRGVDVSIYAHAGCQQELVEILPITPCFEINTYDYQEVKSYEDMLFKFNVMNGAIEKNLLETVKIPLNSDDIILILTVTVHQIVGIRNWYAGLENPKPRICLQFMHQPWYLGFEQDPDFCTSLLCDAMAVWRGGDDFRVTFAADNDLLASFLHKISGFPIHILPMPIQYPGGLTPPVPSMHKRVRFGFLGDGRIEKGLHHFVRAILAQQSDSIPNVDFFVHISNQNGRMAQDILKDVPNCTVLCKQLDSKEYWDITESCDVIVLPYDPKYYRIRGSGILFEAMGLDKPIIVTTGSCLDWLMAKYGASGMRFDFTAESLLDAIRTIASSFDDFKSIAQVSGRGVREKHNPKAFVDALLLDPAVPGPAMSR
jgi:hypothetical protein